MTAVHVVLVRPQGAINVGSVARVVKNFGAASLRLVAPLCDVQGREARMFADRARDVLEGALHCATLEEALAGTQVAVGMSSKLREAAREAPLDMALAASLHPSEDASSVAVVFGNEADGLSREEAESCDRLVRIDTPGAYDSLNLSHAVAVVLSFLTQARREGRPAMSAPASLVTRSRLEREWMLSLERAGYFHRNRPEAFRERLSALVTRLSPCEEDARLLADMWRIVSHRLDDESAS